MKASLKKLLNAYIRFTEKQGFPIIVTLCVAVITATAMWTNHSEPHYISPTPPPASDVSVSQLLQQSLKAAVKPTSAPSPTPKVWQPPVENPEILRTFSTDTMHQGSATGIWSIHDAIDLAADAGEMIRAIADGIVIGSGEDAISGCWLLIDHGDATQALYSGLARTASYITGDSVWAGDVIGFAGSGPLDEQNLPPHLHLRVTRDGQSINPTSLWEPIP